VPPVRYKELYSEDKGEPSCEIRKRVNTARGVQKERFGRMKIHSNSQLPPRVVRKFSKPDEVGHKENGDRYQLSYNQSMVTKYLLEMFTTTCMIYAGQNEFPL
jgi:predicted ATPase with chaperone activity